MDAARAESDLRDSVPPRDPRDAPDVTARPEPKEIRPDREGDENGATRIDGLHAEASAAVTYSANTIRSIREQYREAYNDELSRWQALADELDSLERRAPDSRPRLIPRRSGTRAAEAAEAGAEDARLRALRIEVTSLSRDVGSHQTELAKLEVALRSLETTWLFLKRGDANLVGDNADNFPTALQMRIVEAQEGERSRLAQEMHDGPAQGLSNAIFQVEYIERVIETDEQLARQELRFLRETLRRELGSVRTFIGQLRPPVLDELGLDGAIADAVARMNALTGLAITTDLKAAAKRLSEAQQTVALRIVQEALQNVRKHGAASSVIVATVVDGDDWLLTVRDDGRGFDVGAVAARGRRNFGLQFMQERAELIGARFEVHSRPDGGTLVRLAIPLGAEESG